MSHLDRLRELELAIQSLSTLYNEREKRVNDIDVVLNGLISEADLLDKVEKVLQSISSRVLSQSTKNIDKLVTAGLKIVFNDLNLELRTTVDRYRNKTSIKFDLYENGQTAPIADSYGGGVLVVAGVLLRVATIVTLGLRRMLVLDESLAFLSVKYHDNASRLLKKLCTELKFTVVMVTHADTLAVHADKHYEAKRDGKATTFALVK